MMEEVKRVRGCWTCRLRRKGCDGRFPTCATCERLSITCDGFATTKPGWMDGGPTQQEHLDQIKTSIKNCQRRRPMSDGGSSNVPLPTLQTWQGHRADLTLLDELFYGFPPDGSLPTPTSQTTSTDFSFTNSSITPVSVLASPVFDWTNDATSGLYIEPVSSHQAYDTSELLADDLPQDFDFSPDTSSQEQSDRSTSNKSLPLDNSFNFWSLVMTYFDGIFHEIFSHHCEDVDNGLRGYMLALIARSSTAQFTIMCIVTLEKSEKKLPAHYGQNQASPEHGELWETYYRLAVSSFEQDVADVHKHKSRSVEGRRGAIAQALACVVHLTAVEQVRESPSDGVQKFLDVGMELLSMIRPEMKRVDEAETHLVARPSDMSEEKGIEQHSEIDSECMVIEFCSSMITRWKVLSRSSIQHPQLCSGAQSDSIHYAPQEDLEIKNGTGCSMQTLDSIHQVSDLQNWKNAAINEGTLSIFEFARRASYIEARLKEELKLYSLSESTRAIENDSYCGDRRRDSKFGTRCSWHDRLDNAVRGIYSAAAQVYLYVVVSGPNTNLPEIRQSVDQAMRRFAAYFLSAGDLMSVSWPLYMIASVATDGQRERIQAWFESLVKQKGFSSRRAQRLLQVIQDTWKLDMRGPDDPLTWTQEVLNSNLWTMLI